MQWKKQGLVYQPDGSMWWAKSHAMIPTPVMMDDKIRVYMTCCDDNDIGRIGYIDLSKDNVSDIVGMSEEPILDIGQPGMFDENGAAGCSVVSLPDSTYMYYVGFELGTRIRYRLLTGLASTQPGDTRFHRLKRTPVLERSDAESFFRCGPFVIHEGERFRMWYIAGSEWIELEGEAKPVYEIRYMESDDGIDWPEEGITAIPVAEENEHGLGRPWVVRDGDLYRMFYSIRCKDIVSYRLGYAESLDGLHWQRKDEILNLDVSEEGWDTEMVCYAAVICLNDRWYMFYNGNGFGRTGFGVAELVAW